MPRHGAVGTRRLSAQPPVPIPTRHRNPSSKETHMTLQRRRFIAATTAAVATLALPGRGLAKNPELARILVPFAAGGTMDYIARLLADQLKGQIADTVIVENKAGAAGQIAIDALKTAVPDGTTLMIHALGIQGLYPFVFKSLRFDPFVDVAAVSTTNKLEFCLAVGPGVPEGVKDLKGYLDWVRGDPKRTAFATPGPGTPLHLLPLQLGRDVNVEMNPVHYRGTAAALPELLGGQVPVLSSPLHDMVQQLPTGKIRIIATSGAARSRHTPNVPTYAEQGFPQLTSGDAYAIWVNGKTPAALQEQYSAAVRKALAVPSVQAAFAKVFIDPMPSTPAEALKMARDDHAMWQRIVKAVDFRPE
jgi:tripartite-type tricarboxylate transporter receptor subunit TctC